MSNGIGNAETTAAEGFVVRAETEHFGRVETRIRTAKFNETLWIIATSGYSQASGIPPLRRIGLFGILKILSYSGAQDEEADSMDRQRKLKIACVCLCLMSFAT